MKKINILKSVLLAGLVLSLTFINNVSAQSYYGQNGDVDTDTTSASTCYSLSYNMRKGSRDSNTNGEVTKLQEALVQLGYLNADPTGYFGRATYNAVKNFQSAKGLLSSGFFGTYTRKALYNATCHGNDPDPRPTPDPYPTPNPYINLTPSILPSTVYDKDSNDKTLVGFVIGNSSGYFSDIIRNGGDATIINTNILKVTSSLGYCETQTGATYNYNYYFAACPNAANLLVDLRNSPLIDGQNYYFTIRINQNGTYTDKQYSFTYKKLNANNGNCTYSYQNDVYGCYYNNNNNVCIRGYMNGIYDCYYNVTCNSSYDYNKAYYINNCAHLNGY